MHELRDPRLADVILEAVCQGLPPDEERRVREQFTSERVHQLIDAEEVGGEVAAHLAEPSLNDVGQLIVAVVGRIQDELARSRLSRSD